MTAPAIHLWRLLKWGRTLARHGALQGIERDPNTPPAVRRLVRIARFGVRLPATPGYADALQAIGPAAIKLGQTLATRPDIVGEAAAKDLQRLQDALPPVTFDVIKTAMVASFARPLDELFSSIDPVPVGAASIAQVHRASRPTAAPWRSRCCAPACRKNSTARSTPINGRRHRSSRWAANSPGSSHVW